MSSTLPRLPPAKAFVLVFQNAIVISPMPALPLSIFLVHTPTVLPAVPPPGGLCPLAVGRQQALLCVLDQAKGLLGSRQLAFVRVHVRCSL